MSLALEIFGYLQGRKAPVRTSGLIALFAAEKKFPRGTIWTCLTDLEVRGCVRRASRSTQGNTWEVVPGVEPKFVYGKDGEIRLKRRTKGASRELA